MTHEVLLLPCTLLIFSLFHLFKAHSSLLLCRSPEEILPDLTVQSAKTLASSHLKRFPSDLLESSVDPVLPNSDFQETQSSTLREQEAAGATAATEADPNSMVRVYQQPAVTHRGQTSTSGQLQPQQPLNGFQVRPKSDAYALLLSFFSSFKLQNQQKKSAEIPKVYE